MPTSTSILGRKRRCDSLSTGPQTTSGKAPITRSKLNNRRKLGGEGRLRNQAPDSADVLDSGPVAVCVVTSIHAERRKSSNLGSSQPRSGGMRLARDVRGCYETPFAVASVEQGAAKRAPEARNNLAQHQPETQCWESGKNSPSPVGTTFRNSLVSPGPGGKLTRA
jgi:hypothetical protein